MHSLIVLAWLALHALALFGWGRAVARVLHLAPSSPPLSAALGLAWVICLGGVLNLCAWARPPSQWLVLGAGVALAGLELRGLRAPTTRGQVRLPLLLTAAGFALTIVLVAATVLPSATFNYHDDYQKYFAHAVRMLQTGTAYGSSLSAIGFETLGGQAWLHTFVLNVGDVALLNAADLGLGLALCLALAGFGPGQHPLEALARLAAMAAVLLINPQLVNVSSLFTGAALCTAVLLLELRAPPHASSRAHALATGLLFGALLALKTSFLPLVAAGTFALSCARWALGYASARLSLGHATARSGYRRAVTAALTFAATCSLATLAFVAPWLAVHARSYLAAWRAGSATHAPLPMAAYAVEPFSWQVYDYGSGFAPYTWLVLACVGLSALGFACARTDIEQRWSGVAALIWSAMLAALYVAMLYVIGPISQGELTALRLFIPMLLGVVPAVIIATSRAMATQPLSRSLLAAALTLAPLTSFVPVSLQRAWQAIARGSVVAFAELDAKPWYIAYNARVLHGDMRREVAAAQAVVPEGEALIAWINAPFWLDYRKHRITDLDLAGLETPWTRIPDARYVIWEFDGVATAQLAGLEFERKASGLLQARIGDDGLRLTLAMLKLSGASSVLWNDGKMMVLKLARPSALRDAYAASRAR